MVFAVIHGDFVMVFAVIHGGFVMVFAVIHGGFVMVFAVMHLILKRYTKKVEDLSRNVQA